MTTIQLPEVTVAQFDTIYAALRMLAKASAKGKLSAKVIDTMTNGDGHAPLSAAEINAFAKSLQQGLTAEERAL